MAVPPLQLPGYAQPTSVDWTSLDKLGDIIQSNRLNNNRKEALSLAALGQTGSSASNYGAAAGKLASLGDFEGAAKFAAIQKAIAPESTPDIQNFNYSHKNPEFLPFLKSQAEAKSTKINNATTVNNVGETAYDKQNGKNFAELNQKLITGAQSARMKLGALDRLDQLFADPNTYTGAGAQQILTAKKLAKTMGVDVGDVSGPEAINAIGNQFALELRNPAGGAGMPGAMSDKDREFLQQSVPGLGQTAEGNQKISGYMRKLAQRSIDVERLRQDYVKKNGRLDEGFYRQLEDFSNSHPMFPEAQKAQPQTKPSAVAAPQEGQTATNPTTGQRVIMKGGKWTPLL